MTSHKLSKLFSQVDQRINDILTTNPDALSSVRIIWATIKLEADKYAKDISSLEKTINVYIPFSSITTFYVDTLLNDGKFKEARQVIRDIAKRIESLEEEISNFQLRFEQTGTPTTTTPRAGDTSVPKTDRFTEALTRFINEYK